MEEFVQGLLQGFPALLIVVAATVAVVVIAAVAVRKRHRPRGPSVRVIGVGGAGGNAIERMIEARTAGVDFIACNTDAQALLRSAAPRKVQIGDSITSGLGVGGDPVLGRRAAEEDADAIGAALAGSDIVFVTAGMGGGTGSGAGPVVAGIARGQGALTIGVVTLPFSFEGSRRQEVAREAVETLTNELDAIITVPNDGVQLVILGTKSLLDAFRTVDDVLRQGIQGILDVMTVPGLVNLDLADLKAILKDAGPTLLGIGRGTGEHRAVDAAREAISNPLLGVDIQGARRILFNVTGSADLSLSDVTRAAEVIRAAAHPDANVIFGATFDERLGDEVRITVIATGFGGAGALTPARAHTAESGKEPTVQDAAVQDPALQDAVVLANEATQTNPVREVAATPQPARARERRRRRERVAVPVATTAPQRASELVSEPEGRHEIMPDELDVPAFLRRHRPRAAAERGSTGASSG